MVIPFMIYLFLDLNKIWMLKSFLIQNCTLRFEQNMNVEIFPYSKLHQNESKTNFDIFLSFMNCWLEIQTKYKFAKFLWFKTISIPNETYLINKSLQTASKQSQKEIWRASYIHELSHIWNIKVFKVSFNN